jgi:hypothetical protein
MLFYGKEIKRLNELVQKQEEKIAELENRLNGHNDELIVIGEELFLPSRNGYPTSYDVKQAIMKDRVVRKSEIIFLAQNRQIL